jgi:hypothetical protein
VNVKWSFQLPATGLPPRFAPNSLTTGFCQNGNSELRPDAVAAAQQRPLIRVSLLSLCSFSSLWTGRSVDLGAIGFGDKNRKLPNPSTSRSRRSTQWSIPTMTLEALTMAETESPGFSPRDLTLSFVMIETTSAPPVSFTVTSLITGAGQRQGRWA